MTRSEILSVEHMTEVLDNAPTAVFVSSIGDKKLLYANRLAKELFPGINTPETTCYMAAGFDRPCPFCHADQMSRTELRVREYCHPQNSRIYQLSGKIINWAGVQAHIEYVLDITEKKQEEEQFRKTEEELKTTFSSIPCGLCIYLFEGDKISPVFHNQAFYNITGYSSENIRSVEQETNYLGVHPEDLALLQKKIDCALRRGGIIHHTYRLYNDKKGEYRWIRLDGAVRSIPDGRKFLYGVYSDVSDEKRLEKELLSVNEKMQDIINAIPGGIASYKVVNSRFIPTFFTDGVSILSGHSREEYEVMVKNDALDIIYELDRERVLSAVQTAFASGEILDISYRMRHKDGRLIWIHLNGRRIGPLTENASFYAVFTGMSAETRLFQSIANETADGIYVIDKKNYELLYANESGNVFAKNANCLGKKCYSALYGKCTPCEFCTLESGRKDGEVHEMEVKETGRYYSTRFRSTDWNGIPAYVKYVRDITDEVLVRREKERLEMYFKNVVDKLPGGVSVIRMEADGSMTPEFISDGFAAMTHMSVDEAVELYEGDILAGIHPEDVENVKEMLDQCFKQGKEHGELIGRMIRGDGGYVWVKNSLSIRRMSDGIQRLYCTYTDVTRDMEEKKRLQNQYEDLILQHYRTPGPGTLIVGHCNINRNQIINIKDYTNSRLLEKFGTNRTRFFTGVAGLVADKSEQQSFLEMYLNEPMLKTYSEGKTERILECYIKLPQNEVGCYARFKVNLVEAPETGDITGILTVTDITEKIIADRILHQLSFTSHDYIIDLDLKTDEYKMLSCNPNARCLPKTSGCYSEQVAHMAETVVAPRDKELYKKSLDPLEMNRRLIKGGLYTFTYTISDGSSDLRIKSTTVSSIDLRLGRVCLVCTDITNSVREQQGLLNMIAYTFDLAGFIHLGSRNFTMYTRQMILENLPPYILEDYGNIFDRFVKYYDDAEDIEEVKRQFTVEVMLKRLNEKHAGYDFVFPYREEDGSLRYKQVNVLWGDQNHRTICIVRADVTDMLVAERQSQKKLEEALKAAEKANQAKSEFLSAMSHDIRTPMNAIMGMTSLAVAHLDDPKRVENCLQKISVSSKHLLSLINDVLDMSKIERSQISLNPLRVSLPELVHGISDIIAPQAKTAGLEFHVNMEGIVHQHFYGDSLRLNQIMINLLSNAVKFTPEGGKVLFLVEEIQPVKDSGRIRYRFTVNDTGIGMSEEFTSRIFAPFARDNSVAQIEGTGLGMSITRGLVDLMGGKLSLVSRVNEGSTFRVDLEFDTVGDKAEDSGIDEAEEIYDKECLSGCCFLAAEDNAINAEILIEILAIFGAKTVLKTDGAQAVQAFANAGPGTYDAILMDIQMPVMNGFEATQAIRNLEREDSKSIPIIAMTANAFAEDIQASLNAGMSAHVAKPIDIDVLRATLVEALGKKND